MNTIATVTKRKESDENGHDGPPLKNTKDYSIEDIKQIEDLYNTILDIKSKLNTNYQEDSLKLKKAFGSIQLILPDIKQGLTLPTMPIPEETKIQKLPSQRKKLSAKPKKPAVQSTKSLTVPASSVTQKWMLKHDKPGPGIIELIPNTGIYVEEIELTRAKLKARTMRQFGEALLSLIFSERALRKCSFTGLVIENKKKKRPGLDEYARTVFMDYITKHAEESGWKIVSRKLMTYSMTTKVKYLNSDLHFERYGMTFG